MKQQLWKIRISQANRENRGERIKAMEAFAGIRRDTKGTADIVRDLRRGNRIERIAAIGNATRCRS